MLRISTRLRPTPPNRIEAGDDIGREQLVRYLTALAPPPRYPLIGMPGAVIGLRPEDPTIAEILRPLGYTTGQFGKKLPPRQKPASFNLDRIMERLTTPLSD